MVDKSRMQIHLNRFSQAGMDEESIRVATEDLENGVDAEIVNCYMTTALTPEHRLELATLFRQGMPLELGTRLRQLNTDQLNEVFTYAKERIPFEAIRSIVMNYSVPHQIKKAFEDYKKVTMEYASKGKIDEVTTSVDADKQEVSENQIEFSEKKISEENDSTEKKEPETAKPTEQIAKSQDTTPVVTQDEPKEPVPAPDNKDLINEIHQVFADSTNTLIENINEKNAGIYADMISRFDDGIQAIVDEIRKDMRANYSLQTPKALEATVVDNDEDSSPEITTTPTPQVSSEPATIRQQAASVLPTPPLGSESAIQSDMPSPTPVSSRAPEERVIRRPRPSYLEDAVSYTRMILMPDGSLRPIEVERENPKKPKGLLGLASKIFGKDTPQESLLRQLINGRLSGPQLKQILRAVKAAFSPLEIKDLIESDLEPEEMGNIIDVILADRGQILEVV